jgi:hypothetical protein
LNCSIFMTPKIARMRRKSYGVASVTSCAGITPGIFTDAVPVFVLLSVSFVANADSLILSVLAPLNASVVCKT